MILVQYNSGLLVENIIKHYINNVLFGNIIKKAQKGILARYMNKALIEQFGKNLSLTSIVRSFISNIVIKKDDNSFTLELPEYVKVQGIPLTQFIGFIDEGNLKNKGCHIFREALDESKKEIHRINPLNRILFL